MTNDAISSNVSRYSCVRAACLTPKIWSTPLAGAGNTDQALHVLRYAEQFHWTDAIYIPPSGLLITPQQGEVMRCLMRHRLRGTPQS